MPPHSALSPIHVFVDSTPIIWIDDEPELIDKEPVVEFWGLPPLIPLLQCVNRLGFEICSVNSC